MVGLGLDAFETFSKKDSPFVHHLALSMLPPLLPSILTMDALWVPEGWRAYRYRSPASTVLNGSLTHGGFDHERRVVASAMKQTVMEGIDRGVIVGEAWLEGDDIDAWALPWRTWVDQAKNLAGRRNPSSRHH